MKKQHLLTWIAATIMSSAGLVSGNSLYDNVVLSNNPAAYWPMQETNGPTIFDIASTNNGTLVTSKDTNIGLGYHTNFVTAGSGATDGKTYHFAGPGGLSGIAGDTAIYFTNVNTSTSNSQISVPYNAAIDPSSNLTAEAWIKVPSYPISYTNTTFQTALGLEAFGGAENGWWIGVNTDSSASPGDVQFNMADYPGLWITNPPTSTASVGGTWLYAVEVYTGSNSNLLCYTNGILMKTVALTSSYETEGIYGTHKLPFVIGSYSSPGGASGGYNGGGTLANGFERGNFWHGGISHVAIYTSALTGSQISNHYFFATNSLGSAPSITSQPSSATNYTTQTNTFTVSASGTAPLSYQWKVESDGTYTNLINGGQFSGVTNTTLTITGLTLNNYTNYFVVVTNAFGSVTSAPALLTVLSAAPVISTQPSSQTYNVGQTATFNVVAGGLGTLSYQWKVETNGSYVNLSNTGQFSGVTSTTLSISSLVTGNATNYEVVVTNASGSTTSTAATLTVISNSSSYQTVILGDRPVSYWPMQETAGPTIFDVVTTNGGPFNGTVQISTDGFSSGAVNGEGRNDGVIHETFTNSTSAVASDGATYLFGGSGGLTAMAGDKAVYFTNLDGQLNCAQIAIGTGGTGAYEAQLDPSTFTAEAWLNIPTYPIGWTSNAFQVPLGLNAQGNSGNTDNGWWMGVKTDGSGSGAYGELFFEAGTGTAYNSNGPSAQVFSGKWVYAVQEYNGTATVIYTNGILMASNTQTYKPLSNGATHEMPLIIGSENSYYFGGSTFSGNTRSEFWNGGVSHVAIYNYALTAAQVTNHYYNGTNTTTGTPPSITTQPVSQTNYTTQTATFTVSAGGSAPLSYQWKVQSSGSYVSLSNGGQYSGATSATLSISSLALTNATNYEVVVTNANGAITSAVALLTVLNATPSITTQPVSSTNNVGQTSTFSVTAAGLAPLSYQWKVQSSGAYVNLSNGGQYSGATSSTLTISSLALTNSTNYEVVVTNSAGTVTSSVAALTVLGTPPSITVQPASSTNTVGQSVTFTVSAGGSVPLSYQWKVQSSGSYVNLSSAGQYSGATSSALTISSLALTNATNYEVVVTNAFGSITSTPATLTVISNSSGLTAYQTIIVADDPVAFWPLNETSGTTIHDIVGTNNGTAINPSGLGLGGPGILFSNGVTTDLAIYFTNSSSAYISVPYNSNFSGSSALHFSVEAWLNMPTFPATGASANMNPLSFNNGGAAYGWTWNIQSANGSNPGVYGWLGINGSWTAVNTGTAIQSQWSYYVMTYDGTTFIVYTNGVQAGSQTSTYTTVNSGNFLFLGDYNDGGNSPDGARYYRGGMENVAVYNYTLTPSQVANHNVFGTNSTATFITSQPASQTNFVGQTATFTVTAAGLPPLSYQWLAGVTGSGHYTNLVAGGQFSAVTNSTLSINNLTLGNSAQYEVIVSNSFASVTSSLATLTVLTDSPPVITTQPASQTNTAGQNAILSVTVSGLPPIHYQWQVKTNGAFANLSNGGQYSGVTSTSVTISTLVAANAGSYDVVVTNSFGAVTSSAAVLTVQTNGGGGGTIKLMCIGDSITDIDQCDWRSDLANELTDAGYNYLMVGRNEGTACPVSPVNQNHHEGYSGDTSSDIINLMPGAMAANLPDIAMIHIGANDLSGPAPNQTLINLSKIIRILQASNANMTIVVSQIIPCELCPTIWEYDYLIPQLNSNYSTSTSHVVNADVFDNFACNAFFDGGTGPHPNAAGGQFMANVYFPIITSIMNGVIPTRPPLPPPFPGPSGYVLASFENNGAFTVNFPHATNIAYGDPSQYGGPPTNANGTYIGTPGGHNNFFFFSNIVGNFEYNNNLGDPDPGEEKFGYVIAPGIGIPGIPGTGGGGADWSPVVPAFKPTIATTLTPALVSASVPNQFQMQVTAVANQNYTLQMCTDLTSPNWVSLYTTNSTTNTSFVLTDPDATNKQRFYRVLIGP